MIVLLAVPLACLLDLLIGDPPRLWHPVRGIGAVIAGCERWLRRRFPATPEGERRAGRLLAAGVPLLFAGAAAALCAGSWRVQPLLWLAVEAWLGGRLLAARSLYRESMAVYRRLCAGDLAGAREAVGRIVGRDTAALDAAGVARAAVETVAENTADGVVAPLLYLAVGGAPLMLWYKAVNTLDSMVGYKNERYLHFGRASAKQDDISNFLPARIAAALMVPAAIFCGFDGKNATRILRRDRLNHGSPNSAHTEAACAGALGIRLGGDAVYFGRVQHKPAIGDARRPVEAADIRRANRLMLVTSLLAAALAAALRAILWGIWS